MTSSNREKSLFAIIFLLSRDVIKIKKIIIKIKKIIKPFEILV